MFIVLEGLDGAGKSTQIKMLQERIAKDKGECQFMHFPRYDMPFFGEMVARFLRGDLGDIDHVNPYVVALLYAGNRGEAADEIKAWLAAGNTVILDRYVYSNIAFQCAKLSTAKEQSELRNWIFNLEYEHFKIPRPDISIFLDVPISFVEHKLHESRQGNDREYLHGKQDIHEASIDFQKRVRQIYLQQQALDNKFKIVDCGNASGEMLTPNEIFEKIWGVLSNKL